MAHTLVHLRFAGLVAETVARLTTGSGGIRTHWTTNRNFKETSHPPLPIDQQGLVALK
jgi:hypothetical protein